MTGNLVKCPLGNRCDTTKKMHKEGSRVLSEHARLAQRLSAPDEKPTLPDMTPKAPAQFVSGGELDAYVDLIDDAGIGVGKAPSGNLVVYREDGREFEIAKTLAEDFAGSSSERPEFMASLVASLDNYRGYTDSRVSIEAGVYAANELDNTVSANALANAVTRGRNFVAAKDFMPEERIEFAEWHQDAIDEAREMGTRDSMQRLGSKVLDEAYKRRGIEVTSTDHDVENNRTTVALSDPSGKTYEFSSTNYVGDGGRKTAEEIVARSVSERAFFTKGRSSEGSDEMSENEAGLFSLMYGNAPARYLRAYNDAYIRSRQIEAMRTNARNFLD